MRKNIRKISFFYAVVFLMGLVSFFSGIIIERTKGVRVNEKRLGLNPQPLQPTVLSEGPVCTIEQKQNDKSAMFIGCNGFY
jgi:hypothetical protein